jgi:hypothetical protein
MARMVQKRDALEDARKAGFYAGLYGSRLSRFRSTVKELAKDAASAMGAMWQWLRPRRRMVFWLASLTAIALLLVMFVIRGGASWIWREYHSNQQDLAPILTLAAGIAVASVALIRHFAQTDADRQRRITESFTKAVEHLGTDKLVPRGHASRKRRPRAGAS